MDYTFTIIHDALMLLPLLISGRCKAVHVYSLYATTHYKFQCICVCSTIATGKSLSLQVAENNHLDQVQVIECLYVC